MGIVSSSIGKVQQDETASQIFKNLVTEAMLPTTDIDQVQETGIVGGDRYTFSKSGYPQFYVDVTGAEGSWNIQIKQNTIVLASATDSLSPNGVDYFIWG